MQLAKKSLAVFLSFVLSFSLMGVPAYADDVSSSSGNQTANVALVAQTLEGFGTSEHTSAAQNILPSEYAKQNLVDTIAYVYLDNALIAAGQTQYIAVGFTDEQFVAQNATLTLLRESTNEQRVLTSTSQTAGAVLFAFETTEADIDAYKIQTLTWGNSQNGYFGLSFDEDESLTNTYAFDVVSDELVSTLQEAAAIAQDTNTAVLTIDKKGKLNACVSVEQALALSDLDGMEQGSASASSGTLANDDASQSANMQSGQASSQKGFFQTIFDAIIAFFRDLFVPKDAYAEVSSAREDYLIVAVDPGHGGTDPGAIGNGLAEDNVNYSIATHLVDELSTYSGVSTVLTRSESEYVGLQERVNRAVASGADVIVSIHCNASGTGNAYGSEVWVPNDSSYYYEETHVVGEELGSQILTQLSALGLYNRGVKTLDSTDGDTYPDGSLADYYTVINAARKAGIPGIIVEHAFIDSEDDAYNYLTTDEQRTTLGVADATGIATQYGLVKDTTAQAQASVKVQAYVAALGWESAVYDGKVAGSVGKSFSVEALTLSLQNDAASAGGIEYRSASDDGDWQSWQSSGATTGSTEDDSALNRIQIKLTGSVATSYDVYYRTHVSNVGWLGWAKNGQSAGSSGYGYAIEAIEVVLVAKGSAAPGSTDTPYIEQGASVSLSYRAHVQNIGWQDYVESPEMAGTSGQSLRVEALQAQIESSYAGDIEISTHVQNIGWQEYVGSGEIAGTFGQALRLEAIKVQLTNELAEQYDVYYRVHAQNYGWLDWAKNGQKAGTAGFGLRLEAIEIALVEKGGSAPGATDQPYIDKLSLTTLKYAAHVENIGWQDYVESPEMAGTSGQALRVEALKAQIESPYEGDIEIATHVQNIGWQEYVGSGEIAGTSGQALRLEAIKVQLTNELTENFDVYYRVHAQNIGWMGWAKDGEEAGTAGFGLRLEAIEIALVEKGGSAPESTVGHFVGTSIMGSTNTSVEQMVACYESQGVSYPSSVYSQYGAATITDFCQILYEEATTEGVNAEIVFAQAMTETGWLQFGGDVKAEQCNFAGLGATGNGNPGEDFSDNGTDAVRIGLRAQVQHLKAYASTDDLVQTCVDNRFAYVSRGCAPTLDGLTGTWAADSSYANKLKALVLELAVTLA